MVTLRAAPIHPTASMGLVIGTGVVALVVAAALWGIVRYTVMLAHLGGHAIAVVLLGASVERLVVPRNGIDEVRVTGESDQPRALVLLSGYIGPSIFGLLGSILLNTGRVNQMLWLSIFFLGAAMVVCHSWFTAGVILSTGGLVYFVAAKASPALQQLFGYTWVWFLLIAGIRHVMQVVSINGKGPATGSDSAKLRELTKIPAAVFTGCFSIFNFAALVTGALILVRGVT